MTLHRLSKLARTGLAAALACSLHTAACAEPATGETQAEAAPSAPSSAEVIRSEAHYAIPNVTLTRDDNVKVRFPAELDDGRPVALTFIYTSCNNICPVLSRVFVKVQAKLGGQADKVHLVSITLDPQYDTPARLAEYARKLKAGQHWNHYTGNLSDIVKLEKAFKNYWGDKMNHLPVFLVRPAPGKPWVRLQGLLSADDIIRELGLASN